VGRLPHWVPETPTLFVSWRLAGSRPPPAPATGPNWLSQPRIAATFVEALLHGERVRRSDDLFAWVVMPNHVHIVVKLNAINSVGSRHAWQSPPGTATQRSPPPRSETGRQLRGRVGGEDVDNDVHAAGGRRLCQSVWDWNSRPMASRVFSE